MNPISYARHMSTFSTTALAKRIGVSRQYISRLEQGLYDKPNDAILEWATNTLNKSLEKPVTSAAIEQLYKEWQWQKREAAKMNRTLRPCSVSSFDRVSQPDIIYYHRIFKQWRQDYWDSTHAFCVDLCLHPSPVVDYEDGNTFKMPSHLKAVLSELNLIGAGFKTSER